MPSSVNKLVRGDVEVHLDKGKDGFWLQPGGYSPAIVEQNRDGTWPREVNEVLNLRIKGQDANAIARSQKALKNIGRQASEFIRNQADQNQTWWHQRFPCETEERRTLVRHIRTENTSPVYSSPLYPDGVVRDYTLGIARAPFWEPLTTENVGAVAIATSVTGGTLDYTTTLFLDILGDAGARMAVLEFFNITAGADFGKFWIGIRTDRFGDRTAFDPTWQCGDGTTSLPGDTTLIGGSTATTNWSTTTSMAERFTITLTQAVGAGNEDEQRGQHLVLMRARMANAATEARVRMKSGFAASGEWFTHDFVTIDDNNYLLYSLGSIQIPTKTLHETDQLTDWEDEAFFSVAIEAELVTGSSPGDTLIMDQFIIIPQGEGWCAVANTYIDFSLFDDGPTRVFTTPDDQFLVRPGTTGNETRRNPRIEVDRTKGFYLPADEGGLFVVAAERLTQQVTADLCAIKLRVYHRWTEFRGDDT